ncbi:MAG: 3-hydroxybutyryl-CoA dehydrogenase, partial [Burkholderiales bacterium]
MTGIRTIGVIGAGQMGNGIAHVCALAGFDVILNDVSAERLEAGIKTIQKNLDRQVAREMITRDQRDAAVRRIRSSTTLKDFSDVDFAIEAATEKEVVKRAIFDEVCAHVPKTAMLATNTSSISITRLGAATDRPERFIGLHFMNPVPLMKLVEVIRGLATD